MSDGIFVIGDIHGCYDTLIALMKKLPDNAKVCFVGDLVDRGPKSKEVVQFVIDGNYDCVMGNHEWFMIEDNPSWLAPCNGGGNTMDSYGKTKDEFDQETFDKHKDWMKDLPIYIEYKDLDLVVSHSLVSAVWWMREVGIEHRNTQFANYVMWNRDFDMVQDIGLYNIIGHTPQVEGPKIENNYAIVDTGAAFGYNLTAIHYPSMKVITQENLDVKVVL